MMIAVDFKCYFSRALRVSGGHPLINLTPRATPSALSILYCNALIADDETRVVGTQETHTNQQPNADMNCKH